MKSDWIKHTNNISKKNVEFFFCCDGDGIVDFTQKTTGGFNLYDQGAYVKALSSDFDKAVIQAEKYLKKHYEGIYYSCITQSLQVVLTVDGKTQAFEMEVNSYGVPYFEGHVDLAICEFIGEPNSLLTEMLEHQIHDKSSMKGTIKGKDFEESFTKKSVSYVVLVNGQKCTADQMQHFCQLNAY